MLQAPVRLIHGPFLVGWDKAASAAAGPPRQARWACGHRTRDRCVSFQPSVESLSDLNDSIEFSAATMSERFFVSPPIIADRALLTGDEARHLSAVMRAKVGDEVDLFDGSGAEFTARVVALAKHAVELAIVERRDLSRELSFALTLAVALPKGDRQKWLVEKTTELGVTRLVPLVTERGVAQPVTAALDRLRRSVI